MYPNKTKHEGVSYDCDQCDGVFTGKYVLTNHKQSKHEGLKYECNQCDSSFTTHHN